MLLRSKQEIRIELEDLDRSMQDMVHRFDSVLQKVHPEQYRSALNLLHYLCLRNRDTTRLQNELHTRGLSTFYRAEGYIRSHLNAILQHFDQSCGTDACTPIESRELLDNRVRSLFGEVEIGLPAIMVTFKSSFAHDFITVKKLLKAGMNIARINCAHDDEAGWASMIARVKEASVFTGIQCKICMDLAGPKIRTGIRSKKGRINLDEEDLILFTEREEVKTKLPVVRYGIPGIAAQLKPGERVFFDDGLIETKVVRTTSFDAELEVIRVPEKKPFLKSGKGINFPDSKLSLSALTEFDYKCLPFVVGNADMAGYSFIHNIPDIEMLHGAMSEKKLPLILKIETPDAFNNLPGLLLAAMQEPLFGVMIARGDLAVEMGFERISELQEEIITICHAAHVPVIFATQVLENLNKTGLATRAEVTDASFGLMADGILLNKGPHTVATIKALKDILRNRGKSLTGRQPLARPLDMATRFFNQV